MKVVLKLIVMFVATSCFLSSCNSGTNKPDADMLNSIDKTQIEKSEEVQSEEIVSEPSEEFTRFNSLFTMLQLPLSFPSDKFKPETLSVIDNATHENIRIKGGFQNFTWKPYGRIVTDRDFFIFVTIEENHLGDDAPVLETYTEEGVLIDSEALDFGWEVAEDIEILESLVTINEDLSISISVLIELVEFDQVKDENGNWNLEVIMGSKEKSLSYQTGTILDDGTIQLSEIKNKLFKE